MLSIVRAPLILVPRPLYLIRSIDTAPASVRDQIFDHAPGTNTVNYYLDQEVRFDTQACFLGRPSNEVIQKTARLASLTADTTAPTGLTAEQRQALKEHHTVARYHRKSRELTKKIHDAGYKKITHAKGTPLHDEKKKIDRQLNNVKTQLRNHMIAKARKRHFRNADTMAFEAHFAANAPDIPPRPTPCEPTIHYCLPERAVVVQLTCQQLEGLSDRRKLSIRIRAIEARTALCRRQEARRHRRPRPSPKQQSPHSDVKISEPLSAPDWSQKVCLPTQCIFCLGNERKPDAERHFEYSTVNKMMNEVERHLSIYSSNDQVPCPHPKCRQEGLVLQNVEVFKSHTVLVHEIKLRDPVRCGS